MTAPFILSHPELQPKPAEHVLFKNVLLIEDDRQTIAQVRDILDLYFYDVTTVTNGADAIRHILNSPCDVVLCNLAVPAFPVDMFFQAIKRVRPDLIRKVIALTSSDQSTKIDRGLTAFSIWKPIDNHILLEAIESVFKKEGRSKTAAKTVMQSNAA